MILVVDAGNTRIKWGVRRDHGWICKGDWPTGDAAHLAAAWTGLGAVQRVLAANVAGEAVRTGIEAAARRFACPVDFLVSGAAQCGIRSGYDDPAQLGCDRWAALIGARRLYPGACLVVNAGTAMTVDALSQDGLFLGGIIVPGLDLMRRALDSYTAGLRWQAGEVRFFPANTGDAIMSGAVHALAGAVERMAAFMDEAGQCPLRVVISGGAAAMLAPLLALDQAVVEHLVLEGLAAIAEQAC